MPWPIPPNPKANYPVQASGFKESSGSKALGLQGLRSRGYGSRLKDFLSRFLAAGISLLRKTYCT